MKISLITTVFNEADSMVQFLDSIKKQTKKPDEIIIVDAASLDNTKKIIQDFEKKNKKLKIKLFVKKGNRSVGRNFGIKKAMNEIIAVSDAGCILHKNWLKEIIKPFEVKKMDVSAGFYKPMTESLFQKSLSTYTSVMKERLNDDFLPSSRSIAFKKEAWRKVGGYPEDLDTCEDLVFAKKLKQAGFIFKVSNKALVYWPQRKNIFSAFMQFYNYALGDGQAHYFRRGTPFLFLRWILFIVIALFASKNSSVLYFLILLIIFYFIWAINKNYKYVKKPQAFLHLPLLQVVSDIAVVTGTTKGFLDSFNKND